MSDALFDIERLSFAYPGRPPVLRDVSLRIARGDFIGLIGPNGAGKSTMLNLLTGWLRPTSGIVRFRGRALGEWSRRALAREIGVVAQAEEGIFPFTAEEVVLMGRYAHQPPLVGFDDPEDRAIARGVLALVGLEGFEQRPVGQLSGGERQRVFLARALAQCPQVLLLDEPTSSLDLNYKRDVFRLLERLNREQGLATFVVTHDVNLAALYCRTVIVLHDGAIRAAGPPDEILDEALLDSVYRTTVEVLRGADGAPVVTIRR
ncbi:MAG: ABC transporter ATP-binding protein [Candidatus Sumerlaeia bacterium]|nr:ABC transporter ATP-binding protein [Candidatus Sumerlaeia bacterium]